MKTELKEISPTRKQIDVVIEPEAVRAVHVDPVGADGLARERAGLDVDGAGGDGQQAQRGQAAACAHDQGQSASASGLGRGGVGHLPYPRQLSLRAVPSPSPAHRQEEGHCGRQSQRAGDHLSCAQRQKGV